MREVEISSDSRSMSRMSEVLDYGELFLFLVWRDIKVRYRQTVLGILWVVIQPTVSVIIFTLVFNRLAKISSGSVPYPVFVYAGQMFWSYFSRSVDLSASSLISNQGLISKVFFPRIILPAVGATVPFLDFLLSSLVFAGLLLFYKISPSVGMLLAFPALVVAFLAASGIGFLAGALSVKRRDIRVALPFVIQSLFFLTPVVYPITLIPERYSWLLYLNPMTGVVTLARFGLLNEGSLNWALLSISAGIALIVFLVGLWAFRVREATFSDYL